MPKYAEISFTVDGVEYPLLPPTPALAFEMDRVYGGTVPLFDRVNNGDKTVLAALLRRLCPAAPKAQEAQQAFIYHNLLTVQIAVQRWCRCLENGGMEPKLGGDTEDDEEGDGSGESGAGNGDAVPEGGESL